jgi:preprotein translocase subunit SecG
MLENWEVYVMHTFLVAAQVIVSLVLIITILKQPGKLMDSI